MKTNPGKSIMCVGAVSLMALALQNQAHSAILTWDSDGTAGAPNGGTGTWNTTSALWDNAGAMTTWSNATPDDAVFVGTAGIVTVGETITAGTVSFNSAGYTLLGTGIAGPSLTVSGLTLNANTTLGNSTTTGNPVVRLAGDISGTGTLTSLAAWISSNSTTARLISAPLVIGAGDGSRAIRLGDTVNTGTLTFTGAISTNGAGRGVEVLTGSTAIFQSGVTGGTNSINKGGGGTLVLSGSSTFTGSISVNGGVLELTSTGKLYNSGFNNSAVVTVNAGATWRMPDYSYAGVGQLADYRQRRVIDGGAIEVTGNSHNSGQDFTVNAAGGTFRYTPAGQTLTLSGNANTNINTSGPLTFDATGNISVSGGSAIIEGTGSVIKTGSGTLTLGAANTYNGATTANQGTLSVTGTLRNTSGVTANAGATIQLGTVNMFVSGHGGAVGNSRVLTADGGTIVFTSAMDSRVGNLTLRNGGTITSNRGLSAYDVLLANTDTGPATVTVANTGGNTSPSVMNGSGGIHLQGTQTFAVSDVTASTAADLDVSLILADGGSSGGIGGLAKTGPGTLELSAANTYTGTTSVNEGTLRLDGSLQSAASVASGATLALAGNPVINAAVGIAPGGLLDTTAATAWSPLSGRTLTLGRTSSPATDVQGNLTLSSGSTLVLGSGSGTAATATMNGNLTLDGGTINFDLRNSPALANDTITATGSLDIAAVSGLQFNLVDLTLGNGSYPLVAAAGGITGNPADLTATGLPSAAGGRQTFTLSTTTVPNTLTLDVAGTAAILVWNNAQGTGKWNLNDINWNNSGTNDKFVNGDVVRFENTANPTENIDIDTTVEGLAVNAVNTTATSFALGGTGRITGTTALNVTGGGTLRLANTGGNDFTGAVTVSNNSILELADPAALPPTGTITINSATLDIGTTAATLVGSVTLLGNSTVAGTTGTLDVISLNAQGGLISANLTGGGTVSITNNSTVGLDAATNLSTAITIAAGSSLELRAGASVNGSIANSGTLRGTATTGNTASVTGTITGGGTLQQTGAGTLTIGGSQSFSGNTTVSAGVLDLATNDGLLYSNTYYGGPIIDVQSGATLRASRINYAATNHLGQLTHNSPNNRLSGGTLELAGTGAASARGWTVSGSSTIRTAPGSAHTWLPNNEEWTQIDLQNAATLTFDIGGTFALHSTLMDYTGTPGAAGGVSNSSGGIVKSGSGLLRLAPLSLAAATNTHRFNGPTLVQQGTLLLDANLGTSPVTVSAGASLAVGSNTATIGCGALTLASGASIALDLDSGASSADRLNVAGNLDLGGATLSLSDLGSATLPAGTKFTLLTYTGTLTGTFGGLPDGGSVTVGPNDFSIAYADSNAVTLTVAAGGYGDWAATHAPGQTAAQDFDNDGVTNGVEYILGGTKDTNDSGKLPGIQTSGPNMVFSFIRDQDSKTPDTTVRILVGTNLASWPAAYNVATAPEVSTTDNGNGTETVTLTLTRAPDSSKFARLEVVISP